MHLTKLGIFVQPFAQVLSIVTFGRVNNVSTFVVQVGTSYSLSDLNLDMTRCLKQSIIFISFSHAWEAIVFGATGVALLQAISSNLSHSSPFFAIKPPFTTFDLQHLTIHIDSCHISCDPL